VSSNPRKTNIVQKVRLGGVVAILHNLVYKTIPGCERIGVIAVTTGPNMRIRVLNLFVRVARPGELGESLVPTAQQHIPYGSQYTLGVHNPTSSQGESSP